MTHLNKRKGFTIVELVIVIAVIGVLATVLVPTFSDIIDKAQVSAARSDAMNLYKQYLIDEAESGNEIGELVIHGGNDKYFVFVNGEMQDQVYPSVKKARADFNHLKLLSVIDGRFVLDELGYSNVVVVGHSWTLHPPYSDYWFEDRGMAASVPENDFVSLLELGMKAHQGNVSIQKINASTWERNEENAIHVADSLLSDNTDLVVIRLGENVPIALFDRYSDRLYEYINHMKSLAPNAEFVVCTTGLNVFSPDLAIATKTAGEKAGARIAEADFSSLDYQAKVGQYLRFPESTHEDVKDGYHQIAHPGVATHPSDVGMAVVANSVLSAIGYNQINVTYKIEYAGIQTAGDYENHTQWVRNGLVTVNSSTGPISVVTDSGRPITDITNHGNGFYTFYMPEECVTVSASN